MTRADILDRFKDDESCEIAKEFVDYCEQKFNEIRDTLNDLTINTMDCAETAKDIADKVSDDLY